MAGDEEQEPTNLTTDLMVLSDMGRTIDGAGLAYRSMVCSARRIGSLKALEGYTNLHSVDLSENMIKDVTPLKGLKNVLSLNLSRNEISMLKGWEGLGEDEELFPCILSLDLSSNALTAMPNVLTSLKLLRSANLSKNEIEKCADFAGSATLTELDLSGNKLTNLVGIAAMPLLTKLNVSSNEITEFGAEKALAELPELRELNIAGSNLQALEAPWQDLPLLNNIDVSKGAMASLDKLEVLRQLPKLRRLKVEDNPFAKPPEEGSETGFSRAKVLVCHWRLDEIDGAPVTDEEREEARLLNVRLLEEKEARMKAEAEEAAGAEDA